MRRAIGPPTAAERRLAHAMLNPPDQLDEKVEAIFRELAGADRSKSLRGDVPSRAMNQIAQAVSSEHPPEVAEELGFHLGDWQSDAAFLVALHCCFMCRHM